MTFRTLPLPVLLILLPGSLPGQERAPADSSIPVPPIVVTVSRAPLPSVSVPYAVGYLGRGDVVRTGPGTSLAAALAVLPGITAQNRYNPAQDERIAIRGFGSRAAFGIRGVRILLDGIPQTLPDGQGQLTNIDLRQVSRIEVLRGVSSALYGNASGGVISLWSDPRPDPPTVRPEERVTVGTDALVIADLGVTLAAGSRWLAIHGSRTAGDGFRAQSASETWRASLRGAVPVGARTQVLAAVHVADQPRAEDPGALNAGELAADPGQANPGHVTVDARKEVFQGQAGFTVRHGLAAGGRVDATVFGVRRDLLNVLPFATIDLQRTAYGARGSAAFPLPGSWPGEIQFGADAQWQRDDRQNTAPDGSSVTRDQFERVREIGPFLQVRVVPVPRVAVTAGGRYDDVRFFVDDRLLTNGDESGQRSMSAWSGTVGIAVDAHPLAAPYASVGNGFEAPTTTELANQPDGSDGFNPDLEPQRATQFEIGVRGGSATVRYDVAAFHADVRGALVSFEVPAVPGRSFFRNAGETRHRGVELRVQVHPVPALRITGAYTFMDLRFVDFTTDDGTFDGLELPGVPRHTVAGSVQLARGPVRIALDARAVTGSYLDDANTVRHDGWFVADLRADAELVLGEARFSPYAGLENMFGKRYVEAVRVNAGFGRYYEPAPGRRVFVGMLVERG